MKLKLLVAQSCLILCNAMYCSLPGSFVHGDSPGKNTRVGCHFLLQGMFLTQGLKRVSYISCIGREILYHRATWEVPWICCEAGRDTISFKRGLLQRWKRHGFNPCVGGYPGGAGHPWVAWLPTPVFLPGESHGQRSLVATVHQFAKSWTRLSD